MILRAIAKEKMGTPRSSPKKRKEKAKGEPFDFTSAMSSTPLKLVPKPMDDPSCEDDEQIKQNKYFTLKKENFNEAKMFTPVKAVHMKMENFASMSKAEIRKSHMSELKSKMKGSLNIRLNQNNPVDDD